MPLFEKYGEFFTMLEKEASLENGFRVKNPSIIISSHNNNFVITNNEGISNRLNGHFIFSAENNERAIELMKKCPSLEFGEKIEVYEIFV